tara:strand:- start:869 stop:1345 length:477 start_codon:yes stop_codon:yes gene_type:complete
MALPYKFGDIATGIFDDEFDGDTGYATVTNISGWLAANLGILNTRLYSCFSGSGEYIQGTGGFKFEEEAIYKQLYLTNFYNKKARATLRGIDSSVDFIRLKEGDAEIVRTNKNEIAKTYKGLANDYKRHTDGLVTQYNLYAAAPVQVAGEDGSLSGVY